MPSSRKRKRALCRERRRQPARGFGELFARTDAFNGGDERARAGTGQKNHHVEFAIEERVGEGAGFWRIDGDLAHGGRDSGRPP